MHPTGFRYSGDADLRAPVADVLAAAEDNANILVLTNWVDHLNAIAERLRTSGKSVTILSGKMNAHERRRITDELANRSPEAEPFSLSGPVRLSARDSTPATRPPATHRMPRPLNSTLEQPLWAYPASSTFANSSPRTRAPQQFQ